MAGAADTAKLIASLVLEDKFTPGANKAMGSLGKLESRFGKLGATAAKGLSNAAANLAKIGAAAGVAATVAVVAAVKSGVDSLGELSKLQAQTNAVIESTGAKAGVTASQVRTMAENMENLTTADDKVIQGGINMLLTFTNIGENAFPRATEAMTNMAIAMNNGSVEGLDLRATAIQVGKALNDPIKGVTALRKAGVTFTLDQQKQIKTLVESGRLYDAQVIILKELETEFGKAGAAAGKDFGSDMRRVDDAIEGLQQTLARGLMPVITRFARFLNDKLADPRTQQAVQKLGDKLAEAGGKTLDFLQKVDWKAIGDGLGKAKDGAVGMVQAFLSLPNEAKELILGLAVVSKLSGGAPIKIGVDLVKGAFDAILGRGATPANPLFVKDVTGGLGGGVGAGAPGAKGGGIGLLGGALLGILAGELGALVLGVQEQVKAQSATQTAAVVQKATEWLASHPTTAQLQSGLAGTEEGIRKLNADPVALLLNAGGAADTKKQLEGIAKDIQAQLTSNYQQAQLLLENRDAVEKAAAATRDAAGREESLLRQNLTRPQPATNIRLEANTTVNVGVRDVQQSSTSSTLTATGINYTYNARTTG